MAERRNIGEILRAYGRLSEADLGRALEYQKEHGGFFGEALVALGVVSQDEVDYGLASQADIPYVFPDAESIDPHAAAMVTPEWALAHLTLPIMETAETVSVVVDSPARSAAVEELQSKTDKEIEIALASSSSIRELIRRVFARGAAQDPSEAPGPARFQEILSFALEAGSTRFGISNRGHRAWGWYDDGGRILRHPLEGLWDSELESLVSPAPAEVIGEGDRRKKWEAEINREGVVHHVDVAYMGNESGAEYLFRPKERPSRLKARFDPPNQGVLSEIRLLARSGSARFIVETEPPELGGEILPHLASIVLDEAMRTIYVTDSTGPDEDGSDRAFSVELPAADPERWTEEFEELRPFHFDVVAADLSADPSTWVQPILDIASAAFLRWSPEHDRKVAYDAGIRWELRVTGAEGGLLEWTLEPMKP